MERKEYQHDELEAFWATLIDKPCKIHPNSVIQAGKFGLFCRNKLEDGTWCGGGDAWPSEEWINNYRKNEGGENL